MAAEANDTVRLSCQKYPTRDLIKTIKTRAGHMSFISNLDFRKSFAFVFLKVGLIKSCLDNTGFATKFELTCRHILEIEFAL